MRRPFFPRSASVGLILLAVTAPAEGQRLGGAMMAPVEVPEHCTETDHACHSARLNAALRHGADALLRQAAPDGAAPDGAAPPVERLVVITRAAEPAALKALSLGDDDLRHLAARALRDAIRS